MAVITEESLRERDRLAERYCPHMFDLDVEEVT